MDLLQVIVIALIQGLTEFLPISSTAHLILVPKMLGWPDQGLLFDVAIHMGTLCAILYYFKAELSQLTQSWFLSLTKQQHTSHSRLAWAILWGTIPVGLAGLLAKSLIEQHLRSHAVIAYTTIGFGICLGLASWLGQQKRDEHSLTWKDILTIGCAQALALIPGTSRSGVTLSAGLLIGLTREAAARYAFLLAIPVILLAGSLESYTLIKNWHSSSAPHASLVNLSIGFVISGLTGYLCIHGFLSLLKKIGLAPFVVYRVLLGAYLLLVFALP